MEQMIHIEKPRTKKPKKKDNKKKKEESKEIKYMC
jgi:hypothetical protein